MPFTFEPLELPGVILIRPQVFADERGAFMETYRYSDFQAAGIAERFVQGNVSMSQKSVLRGIHYQAGPKAQGKLVRVTDGRVYDIILDVREDSPQRGRWLEIELSAQEPALLYIPAGYGHGFLVLSDSATVVYDVTQEYDPASERGIIWNDPALAIPWPVQAPILSDKDQRWPRLEAAS